MISSSRPEPRRRHHSSWAFAFLGCTMLCSWLVTVAPARADDVFPVPQGYQRNVDFWEQIYSKYTTDRGLIHDADDLSIIYAEATGNGGSAKNVKEQKQRYQGILDRLIRHLEMPIDLDGEERRVLAFFGDNPSVSRLRRAKEAMRFQLGQRDKFERGIKVFLSIEKELRAVFAAHDLPADLMYLPQVESSFNLKAYSKLGAAGMWQFTRNTGKAFMRVDYIIDERLDIQKSTDAAAKLLQKNYRLLHAWPFAVTAYNHGLSGMLRAKKRHETFEQALREYDSSSFGFASRNFYAEFLAARKVMRNYEKHFGKVEPMPLPQLVRFTVPHFIDFKTFASSMNVDPMELAQINPSLRPPIISGQKYIPKGQDLYLPGKHEASYSSRFASITPVYRHEKQKESAFYVVKRGDTLLRIAKRFGVTANAIKEANLLRSSRVFPRQRLRVPDKAEREIKEVKIVLPTPVKKKATTVVAAVAESERPSERNKAEILAKLIPQVKEIEQDLADTAANEEDTLPPLEKPALMGPPQEVQPETASTEKKIRVSRLAAKGGAKEGEPGVAEVYAEAEETLGHYADWSGTVPSEIRKHNRMKSGDIRLKQKLMIPLSGRSYEDFAQKRDEFHKMIEDDFYKSYRVTDTNTHVVKAGELLWGLCMKHGIPLWLLVAYNPDIDFNRIKAGVHIKIPLVEDIGGNGVDPIVEDTDETTPDSDNQPQQ